MISSMVQLNRLQRFAWPALLAGLALGLATSLAAAQAAPVAKTTQAPKSVPAPAAAAPAAPAAAEPAGAAAGAGGAPEDSAWVKLCLKNEQTGNKQVCLVNHEGLEPNTGMVLVAAAVRTIEGDDKQNLLVRLPTAYSLVMPAGVQIKIDDGEPISLQYAVCFPTSCQVQMEMTKELFDTMRKGKQMVVAAMNMQQKSMAFPVPLNGFAKAFDGPPVDNAKYEEARRAMMEKFHERQVELANKAKDQAGAQAQPGGQAQAGPQDQAGAGGAVPKATTAPKSAPAPAQ
jgi:invasion protein IalB